MPEGSPKKQYNIEYIAIGALVVAALIIGIVRFKKGSADDEVFSRKEYDKKWKEVEILENQIPKKEKEFAYSKNDDKAPFKSPFDNKNSIILMPVKTTSTTIFLRTELRV